MGFMRPLRAWALLGNWALPWAILGHLRTVLATRGFQEPPHVSFSPWGLFELFNYAERVLVELLSSEKSFLKASSKSL